MSDQDPLSNKQQIFEEALAILDPAARKAFLDGGCRSNSALRAQLDELLAAHAKADGFLDNLTESETLVTPLSELGEGPGTQIGKYKLLQQIGEGGMGVVYMAEQHVPFDNRVALKIIKLGMDTRSVVARREAELGILGTERSTPVDGAYIAQMHESWKPMHALLEDALQHCRHARWPEAHATFLQVLDHPRFTWEAGEVAVANLRFLMALAFKRAGDDANYQKLCEARPPAAFLNPLERVAVSLDLRAASDRVVLLDWSKVFQNVTNMGGPEWKAVLSAFGDYAGNTGLTNAAATFQQATNCYHWGRQTVGLALASASKAKLGERDEARELLQQAEAKWRELDENNKLDRAWHWPELTLCELALDEARRQIGKGTVAASD